MSMLMAKFKDQRGQAMVELALVIPLIILLILAIIDFGRVYSAQLVLNHAVRAGARSAVVLDTSKPEYDSNSEIKTKISAMINDDAQYITVNPADITITAIPWAVGSYVTVTASYKVELTAPIVRQIIDGRDGTTDGHYEIESQVIMRRE